MKKCLELYISFFKMGCITFGGGLAMLPILQKEITINKKWCTEEEIMDYFAISQTAPGIIAANVSLFIGYKTRGILGALAAVLGMITPSIIIITIIAALLSNFEDILWIKKAFNGINIVVAALLTTVLVNLGKKNLSDIILIFIAIASFISVFVFKISPIYSIVVSGVIGLIMGSLGLIRSNKKRTSE